MTSYVLVPVVPTPEMITAGDAAMCGVAEISLDPERHVYRAMLAAAPSPAEDGEVVKRVALAIKQEAPSGYNHSWQSYVVAARAAIRALGGEVAQ